MPSSGSIKAGVLIAHQYMGLIDYEKARAEEMASMGYFAFALDVYGKGIRCTTSACAKSTMDKALADLPGLRGLISAGTKQLLTQASAKFPSVPLTSKLVAMGYCFGGSMVLELARHPTKGASDGERFVAVSSIHGTLSAYGGEEPTNGEVVTKVQAHHAELDFQGDGVLTALEAEMKIGMNGTGEPAFWFPSSPFSFFTLLITVSADATWETLKYAKCEHGWTEPDSPIYRASQAVQAHKSTFEFFALSLGFDDFAGSPFPSLAQCS
jgi:dienelactone hydrolase